MENYPYLAEAIAEVLEAKRKEAGLTKTCLADLASIQRCYLYGILKKDRKPTANILFLLCDALGVLPEVFFRLVRERMEQRKREAAGAEGTGKKL